MLEIQVHDSDSPRDIRFMTPFLPGARCVCEPPGFALPRVQTGGMYITSAHPIKHHISSFSHWDGSTSILRLVPSTIQLSPCLHARFNHPAACAAGTRLAERYPPPTPLSSRVRRAHRCLRHGSWAAHTGRASHSHRPWADRVCGRSSAIYLPSHPHMYTRRVHVCVYVCR